MSTIKQDLQIIKDEENKNKNNKNKLPTWAIITISVVGFVMLCLLVWLVYYLVTRKRKTTWSRIDRPASEVELDDFASSSRRSSRHSLDTPETGHDWSAGYVEPPEPPIKGRQVHFDESTLTYHVTDGKNSYIYNTTVDNPEWRRSD